MEGKTQHLATARDFPRTSAPPGVAEHPALAGAWRDVTLWHPKPGRREQDADNLSHFLSRGSAWANTIAQYSQTIFLFLYIIGKKLHVKTWGGKGISFWVPLYMSVHESSTTSIK